MQDIPKPLLALFALIIALFICSLGANVAFDAPFNPQMIATLRGWVGETFLGGVTIDLDEIRPSVQSANQPQCLDHSSRRFTISTMQPCVYNIAASEAPVRTLDLTWQAGNCATVELSEQEGAVPVTLTLHNPATDPSPCAGDPDDPRLSIFDSRGKLTLTCTDGGDAGQCSFQAER